MIIPFAAGTALLLGLTMFGGKKKPADEEDDEAVTVEVPQTDPDLEAAALAAEPGTVPVRDDSTGQVAIVPAPDVTADDDETDEVDEVLPVEEDAETISVPPTAPELDEAAQLAEPGEVPVQDDTTGEVVLVPAEPVAPAVEVVEPEVPVEPPEDDQDPEAFADSLALLEMLLAAERLTNWKNHHKADVKAWQAARGMTADGLLGPKSAARIAQETKVAPIVRYWPSGSWKGSQVYNDYITTLEGLGVDATREQGQGFGSPPKPITVFAELV